MVRQEEKMKENQSLKSRSAFEKHGKDKNTLA
jgi:hypothetical protein